MYRYFGNAAAYDSLNTVAVLAFAFSCFFFFKANKSSMGIYSKQLIALVSSKSSSTGKVIQIVLCFAKALVVGIFLAYVGYFNRTFGNWVGTGVNYFGTLLLFPVFCCIFFTIFATKPLTQMDITTLSLPIHICITKLACFCNGCCWGIPWEYGFYNTHPDHPGRQVPVQAIEAFWAVLIFFILLKYRKKAKVGTMYPMYLILYSATRFCSEFLRREENVLWIFKRYHLICIACFVIGVILFILMKYCGEKIEHKIEEIYSKIETLVLKSKEQKALKLAEEKAQFEIEKAERLEKAKLARQKAKARKRKK